MSSFISALPTLFGLQKGYTKASNLLLHTYTFTHAHLFTKGRKTVLNEDSIAKLGSLELNK